MEDNGWKTTARALLSHFSLFKKKKTESSKSLYEILIINSIKI